MDKYSGITVSLGHFYIVVPVTYVVPVPMITPTSSGIDFALEDSKSLAMRKHEEL